MTTASRSRLDGPLPRLIALGVAVLAGLALLAIHWEDLFPPEGAAGGLDPDSPVAQCIEQERQVLRGLVEEGSFTEDQAARALLGAEARCHDRFGGGNSQVPAQ